MIKRLITITLTATLLFLSSCGKQEGTLIPKTEVYPISVAATGYQPDSKVSLNNNSFTWSQGDLLDILAVTPSGESTQATLTLNDIDAGFASGRFAGSVSLSAEPSNCYFAYPSSANLTYSGNSAKATYSYEGQNGTTVPYLYGHSAYNADGISCQLHHIGGMLQITIPAGITSITVQGNNGESITTAVYDFMANTYSTSGNNSFTVAVTEGTSECYITMPPVNFTKGFCLIFTNAAGEKMYKSYNFDSACDFTGSYAGKIIPIEVRSFNIFALSVSVDWKHLTPDNILTGTNVSMVRADIQGVPTTLIDKWGIDITDGQGNSVKSLSNLTVTDFASTYLTIGDTDYLIRGSYTSIPYIILKDGTRLDGNNVIFQTTPPTNLAITTNVTTSYSYYPTNISKANSLDGSTVYIEQCSINVSSQVLAKANAEAFYTYDSTENPTVFTGSSASAGTISTSKLTDQSWKTHTFSAKVIFDGLTITSPTSSVEVTGLPYTVEPPSNSGTHPWSKVSGTITWASSYVRLKYAAAAYPTIKSPVFHIPSNINVSVSTKAVKNSSSLANNLQVYQKEGSKEKSLIDEYLGKNQTYEGTKESTMYTSYDHAWYIRYKYMATGPLTDIYYFTVKYR